MTTKSNIFRSSDCSCLELEEDYFPKNLTETQCEEYSRILRNIGLKNVPACPSYGYGISCKPHDLDEDEDCQNGNTQKIPDYCYRSWCFVDKSECFSSNSILFEDKNVKGEFFSYDICDPNFPVKSLDDAFGTRTSKIENMRVIFPNEVWPFHFKDPNKPLYDDFPSFDNTEYRGIIIEYLELLRLKTPIESFEYAEKSGGAYRRMERMPHIKNSTYTSAVIEIQANLAHLAAGAYWVTSERLTFTPFTIPIYLSDFYLFELERQEFDILYSIQKTLRPFDYQLWYVLIICIIAFGMTNVMSANARGDQADWYEKFHDIRYKTATRLKRYKIGAQTYLEGIIMGFVEYFGNASEMDQESTITHKVLVFGFGFFILILSSSYTANLASFLSAPKVGDYVDDLHEAIKEGKKICFEEMLEESILSRYSMTDTQKKNLLKPINFPRETFYTNATELLQKHTCDVFLGEVIQLRFLSQEIADNFCASGVRSFGVPVLTMEWAFPVDYHYASHFSQAILDLKQQGTELSDIIEAYLPGSDCDIFIKRTGVENAQLGVNQLFFPFFVLMICICIGSMCKVDPYRFDENGSIVEKISKDDDIFEENPTETQDALSDALIYKYRLDLVNLDIRRAQKNISRFCGEIKNSKIQ